MVLSIVAIATQARVLQLESVGEKFNTKKLHFVDRVGHNVLFRGNEPVVNGSFVNFQDFTAELRKKVKTLIQ